MAEILERGYTREYPTLFEDLSKELSAETCEEVVDILEMYRELHDAYGALADKTAVASQDAEFHGFDGNNEGEQRSYARFLITRLGHWQEFKDAGNGLNSHHPTLDRYRSMLRKWKASADQRHLTREDIIRIVTP